MRQNKIKMEHAQIESNITPHQNAVSETLPAEVTYAWVETNIK